MDLWTELQAERLLALGRRAGRNAVSERQKARLARGQMLRELHAEQGDFWADRAQAYRLAALSVAVFGTVTS
jgi:hypothetical protein